MRSTITNRCWKKRTKFKDWFTGKPRGKQGVPVSAPERKGKSRDPRGTLRTDQWKLTVTFRPLSLRKGGGWSVGPK